MSVKVMSVRIAWQVAETSQPFLALRFHDSIQGFTQTPRASPLVPVMAPHRSLILGWKAKRICGKVMQAKQNEKHFIAVLDARGSWVYVWYFLLFTA